MGAETSASSFKKALLMINPDDPVGAIDYANFKNSLKRNYLDIDILQSEIQELTKSHGDMVELSVLGILSLAIQDVLSVERPGLGVGPISLFVINVADSGEGKSTLLRSLLEPFRQAEAESEKIYYSKTVFEYEVEKKIWQKKSKDLDKRISSAIKNGEDLTDLKLELMEIESKRPDAPVKKRWIYSKSTPTALLERFSVGGESAGLVDSDASGIMLGRTFGDLSFFNVLWDGDSLDLDRAGKDPIRLKNVRLSICLGVQKSIFREFCEKSNSKAKNVGFLARTLLAIPPESKGIKSDLSTEGAQYQAYEKYKSEILKILSRSHTSEIKHGVMRFSDDAHYRWKLFQLSMQRRLAQSQEPKFTNEFIVRAADLVARIAAVRSYFHGGGLLIGSEDVEKAIGVVSRQIDIHSLWIDNHISEESARQFEQQVDQFFLKKCMDDKLPAVIETRWFYSNYTDHSRRGKEFLESHIERLSAEGSIAFLVDKKSKFVLVEKFFSRRGLCLPDGQRNKINHLVYSGQLLPMYSAFQV